VTEAASPLAQQLDDLRRSLASGSYYYKRFMVRNHIFSSAALVERDATNSLLRDAEQRMLETSHDSAG
jgi:hypothetical protein